MTPEDSPDQFERLADEILEDVLNLREADVEAIYAKVRPNQDPREHVFNLTQLAAAKCAGRPVPAQLQTAQAAVAQISLPLQEESSFTATRVLLLDDDPDRLLVRRKLFVDRHIRVEMAVTIRTAIDQLETGEFCLVIVDFCPATAEERELLADLQRLNLEVPVINVRSWAKLLAGRDRQLNRDLLRAATRLLGMPIPPRLPQRRPAASVRTAAPKETLFGT